MARSSGVVTDDHGLPSRLSTAAGAPTPAVPADRLPRPPRRRRPGFAALAVLLVVGSAAAAGLVAVRLDDRTAVLVAGRDIAVGAQITRDDLAVSMVSGNDLGFIPEQNLDSVVGRYAVQQVPAGRPFDAAMLGSAGLLRKGYVAIGVPLKAGNAPASALQSGDRVDVVRAIDGQGVTLTRSATVGAVVQPDAGGFGGGGGDSVATVVVREVTSAGGQSLSAQIAAAAVAGQIVLVLVERGTPVEGGS